MNGLAQITIDGQPVVLKFGMPAIKLITEKMDQYGIAEKDVLQDLGLAHILYAGHVNACLMEDHLPTLLFKKFYNYVESAATESEVQEVASAIQSFTESKYMKQEIDKKKATTTTSESTGID